MSSILDKIKNNIESISDEDIDSWIVDDLLEFYKARINFFSYNAYNDSHENCPSLSTKAFSLYAKSVLCNALKTFIKKEHWKNGRNLNSYLIKSLKNLSFTIKYNDSIHLMKNVPVCPACRQNGIHESLIAESKMLRCNLCTKENDRISKEILNSSNSKNIDYLQAKHRLTSTFALHSKKGYRCPDCKRFIPLSSRTKYGIVCPYIDCIFFGRIDNLDEMAHPVTLRSRHQFRLNDKTKYDNSNIEYQDLIKDQSSISSPYTNIDIHQQYYKEMNVLEDVIEDQISKIKRVSTSSTYVQKLLMYEAYKRMINNYPHEMISYLVHRKQLSDFPIQARIFQEYINLMINYLPFTIIKGGEEFNIVSLTDPILSLFLGKSVFDTVVDKNHIIPNKTKEIYIGGRKNKNYGPCFIGFLIDVKDKNTGKSILDQVKRYGFVNIFMNDSVDIGTPVEVKHFRIPSHYEMNGLVYLQRIRRSVVDSVYFRLNNKKRKIKRGNNDR